MGMCFYLEIKLIFRSIEHIDQPKQKPLCLILVNKSLLVQKWPKPLVYPRFHLNYVSLDHVYLTKDQAWVHAVWVIHAYINENSTYRGETNLDNRQVS